MLRDYQQDAYDKLKKALTKYNGVCVVLPCRSGKSYIMEAICRAAQEKGSKVLILAHRNILLDQHRDLINYPNVRIESVFTEANHLGEKGHVDLIIIDESHISGCDSYQKVCDYYKCKIVGFTATPSRLDGKPLQLFQKLIIGISAKELIKRGNISDYDLYAPKVDIDLSKVPIGDGDYSSAQLEKIMCDRKIYGDVIKYYKQLANNKQAIAYCTTVKHSMQICQLFNDNGYPAVHMDATTPANQRKQILEDFQNGKYKILCCVNIISEGITLPTCEVGLLLRPTQSLALYIQQACRALTPVKGKKAILIDYVGNCYRHGKPTDEHEWSLTEKVKCKNPSGEPEVLARQCTNCLRIYPGKDRICPYCGFDNGKTKKEIKDEKEAELAKIEEIHRKEKRMEVGRSKTFDELIKICKERGYAPGWIIQQSKLKHIPMEWGAYNRFKREIGR